MSKKIVIHTDETGRRGFVREHAHTHGDYLRAFAAADLHVHACVEPTLTDSEIRAKRRAVRHIPEATSSAYLGLPAVVLWIAAKPTDRA